MEKRGRKSRTGNPAAARRGDDAHAHAHAKPRGGLARWLSREANAFMGLPPELIGIVGVLVIGGALALWRWLAG